MKTTLFGKEVKITSKDIPQVLLDAKADLKDQFKHLWTIDNKTGINSIGIGLDSNFQVNNNMEIGIIVSALDQDTLNKIPDNINSINIYKRLSGPIMAQ